MSYIRMFGIAVAAAALMAFAGAGSASAAGVLCSTTASPCPAAHRWPGNTILDFSLVTGGSTILEKTNGNQLDTCSAATIKTS